MLAIVTRSFTPDSQVGPASVRYDVSIVTSLVPNDAGHVVRETMRSYEDPDTAFHIASRINLNLAALRTVSRDDAWATVRQTLGG